MGVKTIWTEEFDQIQGGARRDPIVIDCLGRAGRYSHNALVSDGWILSILTEWQQPKSVVVNLTPIPNPVGSESS